MSPAGHQSIYIAGPLGVRVNSTLREGCVSAAAAVGTM